MARMMTEEELLAFHEINRRISLAKQASGKPTEAKRFVAFTHEIEKHLYPFAEQPDAHGGDGGHSPRN